MKVTIFDILKEITYTKSDLDFTNSDITNVYDIFMINRWLSMVESYVPVVECCNNSKLTKKNHYNYLKNLIPKNLTFFKYIKKNVDKSKELEAIASFYNCSISKAKEYMKLIPNEYILDIMKHEDGKHGKSNKI